MEYYSLIKRNKVPIHATTWINVENMIMKKVRHKKTHFMIPFI